MTFEDQLLSWKIGKEQYSRLHPIRRSTLASTTRRGRNHNPNGITGRGVEQSYSPVICDLKAPQLLQ